MAEAAQHEPKISLPEALLVLEFVLIIDVVGLLLALVGVGEVVNTILDIATFPVTQIYFRMKGVRAGYDLAAGLLELIPVVNALPLRTIGVLVTIAIDWYFPQVAVAAGTVAKIKNPVTSTAPAQAAGH